MYMSQYSVFFRFINISRQGKMSSNNNNNECKLYESEEVHEINYYSLHLM